jgi:MFS family permease
MTATQTVSNQHQHTAYNKRRIYIVSVTALIAAGMSAGLRANIASDLQRIFLDPIDKLHSAEMIGRMLGLPFLGFAFTITIGSALVDAIGMSVLLPLAGVCFIVGTLVMMFANVLSSGPGVYSVLCGGAILQGIAWGVVETVINPLVATLYPDEKTTRMNHLHAWWPGGLIIGGLVGVSMSAMSLDWKTKLASILVPAGIVVILSVGMKFPPTERVAAGVPWKDMFKELLNPLFLVLFCAMFLTAATELAPGQWVDLALTRTVHMQGILLLVYVSGIMFVARHFSGPLVHRLSSIGLMWFSCLLASIGLWGLSIANSPVTAILAATFWGCGVCFMWPTMLAMSSERFPRGGALLIGMMGTAGTLSTNFMLPQMGKIFDNKLAELGGNAEALKGLSEEHLYQLKGIAAQWSFKAVAILPVILLLVFGPIWLYDRAKGGFKAKKI